MSLSEKIDFCPSKNLFQQVKSNVQAIFSKKCFCACCKYDFYPFILKKQWRIRHLSNKFDPFFTFFFESFKSKIFTHLIYINIIQMSQVDSACTKKTCLSYMYNTSVCNQHLLNNQAHIKSVVLIVAILDLNSTFD